ncbi:MFS transporter [Paenibacillus selenitireducens]|uniref:MFS transporter n=1 Tax=Paenibacillus selenitireducens TaxID=1324314 RepID=A0A1T2XHV9_9BACL|nr:MFS transporter [Paenibacillus selenitireducens]OPA79471.1 MFS transporter [Paenibacillus selenitireducens]
MNKILSLLFATMFFIGMDTFLLSPLLPTLRELYGVSVQHASWMVSAYAIGYAVFALFAGPLSDGLNRKKVMIWGLLAFSFSTFLCGLAPSFWFMLLFRFLAGVSASFVSPQIWASIPSIVAPNQVVKGIGVVTAGLSVSQMLGVPLGGYLAVIHWSVPFFTVGIGTLVLVVLISLYMPVINPVSSEQVKMTIITRYKTLLSVPKAPKSFIGYFVFQTGLFGGFSLLGIWLSDIFHLSVSSIGSMMAVFGAANLLGNIFAVRVISRFGHSRTLYGGIAILSVIYLSLSFAHNIAAVAILFFVMAFCMGTLFTLLMSLLQSLSPVARGTIAALTNTCMYAGQTVGALIAGGLYASSGQFWTIGAFAALFYATAVLVFYRSKLATRPSQVS